MDNRKSVGRFHPEFAFSRQNLHIKTVILSILSVGGIKAALFTINRAASYETALFNYIVIKLIILRDALFPER